MAESVNDVTRKTIRAEYERRMLEEIFLGSFSNQLVEGSREIKANDRNRLELARRLLFDELEVGGQRADCAARAIWHCFGAADALGWLPEEIRSSGQELLRYLASTTDSSFFETAVKAATAMLFRVPEDVVPCVVAVATDNSKPAGFRVAALRALEDSAAGLALALPEIVRLARDPDEAVREKACRLLDLVHRFGKAAVEQFGAVGLGDSSKTVQERAADASLDWAYDVRFLMNDGTGARKLLRALHELEAHLHPPEIPAREKWTERVTIPPAPGIVPQANQPALAPNRLTEKRGDTGETGEPENIFRKKGDDWKIRYAGGEVFSIDQKLVGAFYIAYMMAQDFKEFSAEDLWDAHPKHTSDRSHRTVRGADQAFGDPNTVGSDVGSTGGPVMSMEALRTIKDRLTEIEKELAQARKDSDESEEKDLEQEQKMLFKQIRDARTPGGHMRSIDQTHKNRYGAVKKAIKKAIETIRKADDKLGLHLKQSIPLDRPLFQYEPANRILWSL